MDDNGILAAIPGQFIAEAERSLPDAATATEQFMSAVVDTGPQWKGVVRIRCERMHHRHNKHRWWSWIACHAEKV